MASGPVIRREEIPTEAIAVGTLAGVLVDRGDSVEVNVGWMADPLGDNGPSLRDAGTRLDSLVSFLAGILGAAPAPPPVFPGARWYGIPGALSPPLDPADPRVTLAVVAPAGTATTGEVGVGALISMPLGNVDGEVYAYLPLVDYDRSGTRLVIGGEDHPATIGLRFATVDGKGFRDDGVAFDAVAVNVRLPFNSAAYAKGGLIELEFENLSGTARPARYKSLDAIDAAVEGWIGGVVSAASEWLDRPIGNTPVRIADLLIGADILRERAPVRPGDPTPPYAVDLSIVRSQPALTTALGALFAAIDALADSGYAVVELPGGGVDFARRANDDYSTDYGLRIAVALALSDVGGGVPDGSRPEFAIALGSWLTGETDATNWVTRSAGSSKGSDAFPGIEVLALRRDAEGNLSFAPSASLTSVGFKISGAGGKPLVSVGGFTLRGVELRALLDFSDGLKFGGAFRLDDVGLSLAPRQGTPATAGSANPAATTIIGSGTTGAGDPTPVNPTLSLSVAYVEGGRAVVQVYDPTGAPAHRVTIPIQRGLGPITANSLAIGWADNRLSLGLDGGIAIGGLSVSVQGLTVGVPIDHPDDFSRYDFDLDGLGITFAAGGIDLSAAFLRIPPDTSAKPPRPYTSYAGEALVKAGAYALSALGAYAYVPEPSTGGGFGSLFIFAVLDGPLGGPPYFYVTGVAGGFGYNRRLILPQQDAVTTFPLVAAAADPTSLGAQRAPDGTLSKPDPMTVLTKLDAVVRPEHGQYWLAAGIRFTSFDVIQSTALLVVEFGNELEIALLGVTAVTLPPAAAQGAAVPRLAYAELGIEVKLLPAAGTFTATAVLSPSSFVIDPACKLTGGFAFYVWFGSNPHAGEFALTLGGYHPDFTPPDYYPTVPKLGFNWPVGGGVTIAGNAYFALTPSAAMAGGGLQVLYEGGDLRAWFRAEMNALVVWAPLHYQLTINVSVGASYRATLLFITATLSVELSAQLTLWGPPTGGTARINWYVISFTVDFGAGRREAPPPLDWRNAAGSGFAQRLIPDAGSAPAPPPAHALAHARALSAEVAPAASPPQGGVYTIAITGGLLTTFQDKHETVWVVRRDGFTFSAVTAIPATEVSLDAPPARPSTELKAKQVSPEHDSYFVCVRPMKATLSDSTLTVSVHTLPDGATSDLAAMFDYDAALQPVPAAKWGQPLGQDEPPEPNAMLKGRLLGVQNVRPKAPDLTPSGDAALDVLVADAPGYDTVDRAPGTPPPTVPLDPTAPPVRAAPLAAEGSTDVIHDTLADPSVIDARNAIYQALQQLGSDPGANGPVGGLAADPASYLNADPLLAA